MTATGKWCEPGVPHKGWICTGMEDLEHPSAVCEMCEAQTIRYVHTMYHPDYPEELEVGCICAGHMEQDREGAKERESVLVKASTQKKRWLSRRWYRSRRGTPYLKAGSYLVMILERDEYWSFRVLNRATNKGIQARKSYPTEDVAKLRAFDAMTWLKMGGRANI